MSDRIAYYYESRLSENIVRTDEGYLICKDAIIGRTGFQKYKGRELPKKQLAALGVEVGDDQVVDVYRPESEVFEPEAIASFEGKPITDGHPPDMEFVDPSNIERLQRGHLQNVRQGAEALESGEYPLLADVLITHEELIDKVEKQGLRELSCGYDYNLALQDGQLIQKDIRGNHVAVVPRGRAGAEARINDAAPEVTSTAPTRSYNVSKGNYLTTLLSLGLKAFAVDAKPEELAEAVKELHGSRKGENGGSEAAAAHADPPTPVRSEDSVRLHKALDRVLAKRAEDTEKGEDADLEELKKLLADYLTEEEAEEQHQDEGEGEHEEAGEGEHEEAGEGEDSEEEGEEHEEAGEKGKAGDALLVEPIGGAKRRTRTINVSPAATVLRMLRPGVARSKDPELIRAFDSAAQLINKAVRKGGGGGYGEFGAAATARTTDTATAPADAIAAVNAEYKKRHRQLSEVK